MSVYKVSAALDVPRRTLRDWMAQRHEILAYDGNLKNMKLEPGGRYEDFPDPPGLIEFINHVRDNERALTTTHLILWIKANQREWLTNYLATKQQRTSYDSLLRLLQRFCDRHGFSRQRPTKNKVKQADLADVQSEFAAEFHREYIAYGKDCVYNVDETGIYYDMPPRYIWAVRGGSSKISSGEKHSLRMTAVLTVRADGTKLPILFIMKGVPGGRIESGELATFPSGHHYAVQERAWMDKRVWATYLRDVLGEAIEEPSVVLLDNFESHVSGESYNIMYEELGAHLCALPPNATSVCQPLDVGVMAPFKRNLRNLWLLEDIIVGDDDDPFSLTAREKRMALVKRSIAAWDLVSSQEIRRSFEKALPQAQ
ncbi:hypothetical protein DYB30_010363 [Aphanomyces astaci]|uniref:DDE-1 domain-containing protein n=1 Tax=Aphanomyces astaci TaxID=112090 RepID=A0A397DBP7_APHAT|nr:hypothetical protein DYB30_010363 [Aphanomyces astaci]